MRSSATAGSDVDAPAYGSEQPESDLNNPTGEEPGLAFVNEWLSVTADGLSAAISAEILQIPVLSPHGRQQLYTDLSYLRNVVGALGLIVHPVLDSLHSLLDSGGERSATMSEALGRRMEGVLAAALAAGRGSV